jgi:HD superfamily phosphodiesterase
MIPLAKKIYEANVQRFEAAELPLRSHGPDHHLRVYQHALKLAAKLDVSYDADILAGAALLHDMAAYYPEKAGEQYHDLDHQFAAEVLKDIDFPEEKIEAVLFAIAHHGSDAQYKHTDEPIEVSLLRDADKLDVFGPIGVARIMMVRTLKGDTLQDIVDDFYVNGHLDRKWNSITYDETKEIAQSDYEYSKDFFKQLHETLNPSK